MGAKVFEFEYPVNDSISFSLCKTPVILLYYHPILKAVEWGMSKNLKKDSSSKIKSFVKHYSILTKRCLL